ncbi:MAG: hypothetical protein EXQ58_11470 [Acidobacteria bacterium]|nr:hypothetical protein [Acidobacteriota bacterium]
MKPGVLLLIFLMAVNAQWDHAQLKSPVESRNAALRYWMAFADMQDLPADKTTQDLLEKTAAGKAAWDEARLGPILNSNGEALQTMQHAARLPDCDLGLECGRGPRAPTFPDGLRHSKTGFSSLRFTKTLRCEQAPRIAP